MRSIPRLRLLTAGLVAIVSMPATTRAQPAVQSFSELARVVAAGQSVTVTDAAGVETTGRVTQLSPTSLTLALDSAVRSFTESEVRLIQRKHKDSLLNGALIGAGVTVAVPLTVAAVVCASEHCDWSGQAAALIAVYAGVGAGIGSLIDLAVTGKQTIYLPSQPPKPSVSIAPSVARDGKGVQVVWRF